MTAIRSSILDPVDNFFPGDYRPYKKVKAPGRSVSYFMKSMVSAGARLLAESPVRELPPTRWQLDIREHAKEDFVLEHISYLLQKLDKYDNHQRFSVEVTKKGHTETLFMFLDALVQESHTALRSEVTFCNVLPIHVHGYGRAFERLEKFAAEQENWDGYGGIAALPEVVEETRSLLGNLCAAQIPEPGLAMGGDGSVGLFWSHAGYYVSVEVDGTGEYVYLITKDKAFLCDGDSRSELLEPELKKYLNKIFTDEKI